MRQHPQQSSSVIREARLAAFQDQVGLKVTQALARYHQEYVEPRLWWLELPFYRRWWLLGRRLVRLLRQRLQKRSRTPQEPSKVPEGPPTPPEPSEPATAPPRLIV